jgi:hypothetical protein
MGFRERNQKGEAKAKKESKKVDELGSGKKSPVPRHAQKAEPKPKRAPKKKDSNPSGALTKAEAANSLWAKPKRAKKTG